MSRFADKAAVTRIVVGDCECDGKPHDEDWMDVRSSLSGLELATIENSAPLDNLKTLIVGWNFGPMPPDEEHLEQLTLPTIRALNEHLTPILRKANALPNASGAPSRNGSRGSASHTRTIPTKP